MRVYIASLSDYNNGRLEGKWFDLSDYLSASDLMDDINDMLKDLTKKYKKIDGEVREEWAVHDYEGIPPTLASEYMGEADFEKLLEIRKVAEDRDIPVEVLVERAGDTGSDDYEALADSLVMVVDGYDETNIVYELEDQLGDLGYDFWQDYIFITATDQRLLYGEDVDRFREDILYENPDMDEEEAERQAEEMADEEESRRNNDLIGYIEELGYEGELPNWVAKDYNDAWKYALSYDYDVIHHDDQMYVFTNNYSVGGTILSGLVGAYIGYKIGRSKPQKKGFETEKKIGRKIKGAFKKKFAGGGKLKEGYAIMQKGTLRTDAFKRVEVFPTIEKALFKMSHVPLFKSLSKEEKLKLIVPYSASKMAGGGGVAEYWKPIDKSSIYRGVHDYSLDGIDDDETPLEGEVWIKFKSIPKGVTNLPYEVKRAIESDFEYYGYSNSEYPKSVDLNEGSWFDYYISFRNLTYKELEELLLKLPEQVSESLEEQEIKGYGEIGFNTYGNYIDAEISSDYQAEEDEDEYAKGGGIGFKGLSAKVAKRYEGKKPEAKYRAEYGKRYSKSEAKEVGDKVAGKVYWQQKGRKMAMGGEISDDVKVFSVEKMRNDPTLKRKMAMGFYIPIFNVGEKTAFGFIETPKSVIEEGKAMSNVKAVKYKNGKIKLIFGRNHYSRGGNVNEGGKILQEISTHKAVKKGDKIYIYIKGMPIENAEDKRLAKKYPHWFKDELIRTIPAENEDDLFYIFENYEEENRSNLSGYARGGQIGQEIVFDDNGEENTGVIKDITNLGDYVVKSDDGRTLLAQRDLDVISLGAMRSASTEAPRKRFGFFEDGGDVDEVITINIQGYPYYLKKMGDTTHFKLANSKEGIDYVIGSHIGQHKGEEYYSDVASWLKGGKSPNGKSYNSFYYSNGGGVSGIDDLIRG